MEKWKEEFNKLEICCDDCCDHERENRPGVETRVRNFIEKVSNERYKEGYERGIREVIDSIPDSAFLFKLSGGGDDLIGLKNGLKAKFL